MTAKSCVTGNGLFDVILILYMQSAIGCDSVGVITMGFDIGDSTNGINIFFCNKYYQYF